jgi:hypothetical protein
MAIDINGHSCVSRKYIYKNRQLTELVLQAIYICWFCCSILILVWEAMNKFFLLLGFINLASCPHLTLAVGTSYSVLHPPSPLRDTLSSTSRTSVLIFSRYSGFWKPSLGRKVPCRNFCFAELWWGYSKTLYSYMSNGNHNSNHRWRRWVGMV